MGYGWDDDTSSSVSRVGDYDYKSARKAYKSTGSSSKKSGSASRSKSSTVSRDASAYRSRIGKTPAPVGKNLTTESTHPIVIAVDETGSMQSWPGLLFEKLALLGKEVKRYAPHYAISFVAFGDVYCDKSPLQVRDFDSGENLDEHILALYPEGEGGDTPESQDMVAYYYLNHCNIDKAVKPIFIFITDAPSHDNLKMAAIKKYTGDVVQSSLDSIELLKKLGEKFSVYALLKDGDAEDFWKDIYGPQRVKTIEEPRDVVELLIGIIANELGELKDFEMRSSKRHEDKPDRTRRVMRSLKAGAEEDAKSDGKAKSTKKSGKSMKSKKLA